MFIAQTVNELPNVVGLHEGQILSGSSLSPRLPLNLSKIEESMIFSTDDDEMDDYQTFFGLYFTQLVISWMWLRTRSTEPRIPSE